LTSIGTVTAVQGVTVSADLPGIVETIAFESGSQVAAGAVLVRLDASQEQAQLAAALAEVEVTALHLERQRGLVEKGITTRTDFDRALAAARQAEAKVKEVRATIERKTIRAPFAGSLGIRQVNLGQYLDSGAPIVPLQALDPIYVEFSVPQQQVASLAAGVPVSVTDEGEREVRDIGTISAIDSVVDAATRNVKIQAVFDNGDRRLRPGMFVEVRVEVGAALPVIALPASAVAYAPFGDSVFVVEELALPDGSKYRGARQQFVQLGGGRGDQVAVLSGLKDGDEIVTSGVFKLRNGAAVAVDNSVQPSNSSAPEPEDS
jgi:membrane fusion protein (multidrug efflux system)